MKYILLLIAAFVSCGAAAESDQYLVKFDLANLDGKKGEYGSFTLEVRVGSE